MPSAKILEVQVFLDGDRFVTLGSDKLVVIWKISLGGVLRRLNTTEFGGHRTMRLLPEGDRLITAVSLRADGPAVIWDLFWGSAWVCEPSPRRVHRGSRGSRTPEVSGDSTDSMNPSNSKNLETF